MTKFICQYHQNNPNQRGVMNCNDCNKCSKCGNVYYNDFEEQSLDDICPYCGEPGNI